MHRWTKRTVPQQLRRAGPPRSRPRAARCAPCAPPADCCDGSDELDGCTNTCIEKNAAVREGLKQKVEDYKRALDKRREYAAGAAARRAEMGVRLGSIDGEIAAAEKEVERTQGGGRVSAVAGAVDVARTRGRPSPMRDRQTAGRRAAAAESWRVGVRAQWEG
jgi:hypothetical protein